LILLLAGALRVAWAAAVPVVPISDCNVYDTSARTLAAFNIYGYEPEQPWAYWPVGAPFAYSLAYRAFDPDRFGHIPIAAFNAALGVFMVGLGMACAHRWFGRAPAIVTGLILALWPTHIQFTTIIASETLFIDLVLAGLLAWPERLSLGRFVLTGCCFAAASYVRPTALLIPLALAAARWLRAPRFKEIPGTVAGLAIILLVMGIAIAPWAARNRRLFGQVVLISTNGGSNLWMGNSPGTTGEYKPPPAIPGLNEAQQDAEYGRQARQFILEHPVSFIGRTAIKAARLHAAETIGVAWNIESLRKLAPSLFPDEKAPAVLALKLIDTAYWVGVLGLGCAGAVLRMRRTSFWQVLTHPAFVIWAYFTAIHAVIVIQDRYHLPSTPMIASFASLTLLALDQRMRKPAA
jgi:hypothetical protein